MVGKLVACPSCSTHVLSGETHCPQCGAEVRDVRGLALGRTAGAVLMGLALAGCPSDDDSADTMGGTSNASSGSTSNGGGSSGVSGSSGSDSQTSDPSTSDVTGGTSMDESGDATTFASSAAYGVPTTGFDTSSTGGETGDTDTDTDGTSTGFSPDYGVPTTGE